MSKQKNLLKNMQLNSVDLCERGCNPQADIKLMKSMEEGGEKMDKEKWTDAIVDAVRKALGIPQEEIVSPEEEMNEIAKAWQESSESIWNDTNLSAEERYEKLEKSREEMNDYIAKRTAQWAGVDAEKSCGNVEKEEENTMDPRTMENAELEKQEEVELNFDDLSEEDQKAIAEIYAKYQTKKARPEEEKDTEEAAEEEAIESDEETSTEEMEKEAEDVEENPEVKKALSEMAEIKKAYEAKEMLSIAKKYEPLGKDPEETASMLAELKKSDVSAYNQVIKIYDESLAMQEACGIFKEYGTSRQGGGQSSLNVAVAELKKAHPEMKHTDLVELAYRTNPNLSEY